MKPLALVAFLGCVSHAAASAVLDARTAEDSFVIDVPHKEHRRLQSDTTCPVLFGPSFYCDSDTNLGYGFTSPEACGERQSAPLSMSWREFWFARRARAINSCKAGGSKL